MLKCRFFAVSTSSISKGYYLGSPCIICHNSIVLFFKHIKHNIEIQRTYFLQLPIRCFQNLYGILAPQGLLACSPSKPVGSCERGNEHSGTIKSEKFLDELKNNYILKDFAPRTQIIYVRNKGKGKVVPVFKLSTTT